MQQGSGLSLVPQDFQKRFPWHQSRPLSFLRFVWIQRAIAEVWGLPLPLVYFAINFFLSAQGSSKAFVLCSHPPLRAPCFCLLTVSVDTAGMLTHQKGFCFTGIARSHCQVCSARQNKRKPLSLKNLWRSPRREIVSLAAPRPSDTKISDPCLLRLWGSGAGFLFLHQRLPASDDKKKKREKCKLVSLEKENRPCWKPVTELTWSYDWNSCNSWIWATVTSTHCNKAGFSFAAGFLFSFVCTKRRE